MEMKNYNSEMKENRKARGTAQGQPSKTLRAKNKIRGCLLPECSIAKGYCNRNRDVPDNKHTTKWDKTKPNTK